MFEPLEDSVECSKTEIKPGFQAFSLTRDYKFHREFCKKIFFLKKVNKSKGRILTPPEAETSSSIHCSYFMCGIFDFIYFSVYPGHL